MQRSDRVVGAGGLAARAGRRAESPSLPARWPLRTALQEYARGTQRSLTCGTSSQRPRFRRPQTRAWRAACARSWRPSTHTPLRAPGTGIGGARSGQGVAARTHSWLAAQRSTRTLPRPAPSSYPRNAPTKPVVTSVGAVACPFSLPRNSSATSSLPSSRRDTKPTPTQGGEPERGHGWRSRSSSPAADLRWVGVDDSEMWVNQGAGASRAGRKSRRPVQLSAALAITRGPAECVGQ